MTTHRQDAADALEQLIDQHGLETVLDLLADVCHEKADHLRTTWQDRNAARMWDRDAMRLQKIAHKLEN